MDISPELPAKLFDLPMSGLNMETMLNSWLIMLFLGLLFWWVTSNLDRVPGRLQAAIEMFVEFLTDLCNETLGEKYGRRYMPFIATIFVFVTISNMIGMVPNFLWWAGWPGFYCPTQDLNTPLALALVVFFVVHISAISIKGFRDWLWNFFEPSFPATSTAAMIVAGVVALGALYADYAVVSAFATSPSWASGIGAGVLVSLTVLLAAFGYQLGRVPNVFMAPLNIVGELGKTISHPFRLYGNVFGGFVITIVLSNLMMYVGLPPFLNLFFNLFIGVVHAFVFAMLALAYIAVQIN